MATGGLFVGELAQTSAVVAELPELVALTVLAPPKISSAPATVPDVVAGSWHALGAVPAVANALSVDA
jgi:hypothetical protein